MHSFCTRLAVLVTALAPSSLASTPPPLQHAILPPVSSDRTPELGSSSQQLTLRHIYHAGSHKYPGLMRKMDVGPDTIFAQSTDSDISGLSLRTAFDVQSSHVHIQRMADRRQNTINSILNAARLTGQTPYLDSSAWTVDEVLGPNITNKPTVLSLALMASNAYILLPGTEDWEDVKGGFNYTEDFGWEADGLRGHIFADNTNKTIVLALKGTSMAIFDGAETTGHDKENDNLFASCCCGQGGQYFWKQVCDCQTSTYTCNSTCLSRSLQEKSHYYHAAMDLYTNVTERYPNSDVWLTGHSLGGVVTALLGLTYGLPTVTFEAFPDALAAGRLGLPTPPGYSVDRHQERSQTGIYHFGHTADPVFMGTCNAASSSCTIAGYAMESQCHTGKICVYDTVADLGWRVGVGTHRISAVVRDVIRKYDNVPTCEFDDECVDCFNWKFYESNGTETTTTAPTATSTTRSSTRTATCQTPGWWGCLDSTTSSTVTQTSTITTTSCISMGWFGCKDSTTNSFVTTITTEAPAGSPTVTTIPPGTTSSTSASTTTTSVSCTHMGWFGCKDPVPAPTTVVAATASATPFV